MYLKHFKLKRKPFDQLPNPDFLFLTEQHEEALTRMRLALAVDDSFAVVTGEVGSGKTTLVRKVLSDMGDECVTAFITHTRLSDIELLQFILVEFDIRPFDMGKTEMITVLRRFVSEQHANSRRVVIVVDEAQNLGIEVLEELRLLTCLDSEEAKALNIILVGQPQLSHTLQSADLDQLRQRCRLQFHLRGLSEEDTGKYIHHRMAVAKGKAVALFDESAVEIVYQQTQGVPRLINTLCDTALMMACIAGRKAITSDSMDEAIAELGWTPFGSGGRVAIHDEVTAGRAVMLTVKKGNELVSEHFLNLPSYIVGRADDCGINIKSKYLSRHHALISFDGGRWMISDLKSTNGIFVKGRAVQSWHLADGDVVDIGEHQLVFAMKSVQPVEVAPGVDVSDFAMAETIVIDSDEFVESADD